MNKSKAKLWTKWETGDITRIAIDLPQGLGDQIMCYPLLYSLKKYNSKFHITVLVSNLGSQKLLAYNKNIDRIITYELDFSLIGINKFLLLKFIKLLFFFKKEKFDLVVYIHPNPVRTLLYCLLPAARKVYNRNNKHKFYEVEDILHYLKIPVVADYSIDFNYSSDILCVHNLKKYDYIVIDLYAQHLEHDPRQWPHFEELIRLLSVKTSKKIVITGINDKHQLKNGIVDLVNRTTLDDLLYVIKNAALVISMDTFLFHLSYVFKTPVIALFGPVDPEDRKPTDGNAVYKTIYKNTFCSPCIKNKVIVKCNNNYQCMNGISVQEVIESMEEFL